MVYAAKRVLLRTSLSEKIPVRISEKNFLMFGENLNLFSRMKRKTTVTIRQRIVTNQPIGVKLCNVVPMPTPVSSKNL